MDHSYFRDKISAYFDGALEEQERELIRRHLEECSDCRMLLQKLHRLSEIVDDKSSLKGDEYFERLASKIEQRISGQEEKVVDVRAFRWKSIWWKVSAAAATVLLVATIGYYQLREDKGMPSKVLREFENSEKPASADEDSILGRENFGSGRVDQTGQYGQRERTGKDEVAVGALKKKETAQAEDELDKDTRQEPKPNERRLTSDLNAPPGAAPKSAELKAEMADEGKVSAIAQGKVRADSVAFVDTTKLDKVESSSETVIIQQNTLAQWRNQRDSIQNILGIEKDTLQNVAKNQMNRLAMPSVSGYAQAPDSLKPYQELAKSWFQIGLQTQDSTEKNRAIQFLNWYKTRFPVDSLTVKQQLQQLPK